MKKTLLIGIVIIILGVTGVLAGCVSRKDPTTPQVPPTTTPAFSFDNDAEIPAQEAKELMSDLSDGDPAEAQEAIETIVAAEDVRFISVLIELQRAFQIGLLQGSIYQEVIDTLEDLSGQYFGDDWFAWVEWYGKTNLSPPPGFIGWKGELLGIIDPEFEEFLTDDHPTAIRPEEIVWGGVLVDGIPALDNPTMIPAEDADYLVPEEPVFGISINGDHRAYPLRILDWHEMANDVVGGVPVSLAYCTLCGAGIAYDGRITEGETYTFGSSGFLYRSNKLMYDRQTRTLWNQFTGKPVLGELVGSDLKLQQLPVVLTRWDAWMDQHPDTKVLDINTGYQRPYDLGAAYGDYFADDDTMFPVWQRSDQLEDKSRVYGLQVEGIPKAYPLDRLIEEEVVNDIVGDTKVVLIATRGEIAVDGVNRRVGEVAYPAGGEVRAYIRGVEIFSSGPDANSVTDSEGETWEVTEEALVRSDGKTAPRLSGHLAYWFGWFSFFPNTQVYGEETAQIGEEKGEEQPPHPDLVLEDYGPAPELANEVWLNTEHPLRLADLRGNVVLLDMWTFG